MPSHIVNPRRTPRVLVELQVDLAHGREIVQGIAQDVGPGGCLVTTRRPLVAGAPVQLLLRARHLSEGLSVQGHVAWAGGGRVGVRFAPGPRDGDPRAWFQRLVERRPELVRDLAVAPERIALDTPVFLLQPLGRERDLARDEQEVVSSVEPGDTLGALARRSRLGTERFTRAVFALLHRRVLTVEPGEAAEARRRHAELRVVTSASDALRVGSSPALRPAPAEELFSRACHVASRGQVREALAAAREALAMAPRDPEIASFIGRLAFGR